MRFASAADLPPMLTPTDLCDFAGIKIQTLANWRHTRRNALPYIKAGRLVRYRREDVLKFLEKQTVGAA